MKLGVHIVGRPGNGRGKLERTERCGGADLRHNSLLPHGDPRRAFFISRKVLLSHINVSRYFL